MVDRPIIFSAPMIRALLEGRKTQTRRVIERTSQNGTGKQHVRFAVGDRLWVRETWAKISVAPIVETIDKQMVVFRESDGRTDYGGPWRSPIHMPRWVSRLTLIVESVKVERLQDISYQDVLAEGIQPQSRDAQRVGGAVRTWGWPGLSGIGHETPQLAFFDLWVSINGATSYRANPWVAAIGFRVIQANIDAPELAGLPSCRGTVR